MDIKKIHQSKTVVGILIAIGIIIIALVILRVGVYIGYHKASYAGQYGNNFERNFLGPRAGMRNMMFGNEYPSGHGAVGEIVSVNLPQFVVAGPDKLEKTVLIGTSTLIRRFQEEVKSSDLRSGDYVIVLGNPNTSGQIESKLIRIMPAPLTTSPTMMRVK
ncbi:MAG: hypothetical protein NT077_03155 [Candidatus Taylorbacteria bacterium]|nr:hypothetical protein [Candidatus Taylorbacteria bacterium]